MPPLGENARLHNTPSVIRRREIIRKHFKIHGALAGGLWRGFGAV